MNPEPVESNFLDGDSLYFGDHTQGCPPINRNHWPLSLGITVRLASESLAAFPRISQAPALVRSLRQCQWCPRPQRSFSATPAPHRQPFLPAKWEQPFVIDLNTLSAKQDV